MWGDPMFNPFKQVAPFEPFEPMPIQTEDEALQTVGFFDAMAAQNLDALRHYRAALTSEIAAKEAALAVVNDCIARAERMMPSAGDLVALAAE